MLNLFHNSRTKDLQLWRKYENKAWLLFVGESKHSRWVLLFKSSAHKIRHNIYRLQPSTSLQHFIRSATQQDSDVNIKDKTWTKTTSKWQQRTQSSQLIPIFTAEGWLLDTTTLKIVKRMFPIKACDKNHQETKIRNSRSKEQNAWILKMFNVF
jgi:hypothetical protein